MENRYPRYLKPASIAIMVFAAGLLSGYFIFSGLNPTPQDQPPPDSPNPVIHQFYGMLIFERWGEDNVIMPKLDGTLRNDTMHMAAENPDKNFTTCARRSTYSLNQTQIWHYPPFHIPTTRNVSYVPISVNSSEICDLAFVCEETISNATTTMHKIRSVYRPMGLDRTYNGVDYSEPGGFRLIRDGYYFYIPDEYQGIPEWAGFSPHSIFDDLNITYNYRIEIFHEVEGAPVLTLSMSIPTLNIRLWDDPDSMSGGIERDLTITTSCSYYSIVDTTNTYPRPLSHDNQFTYDFTPTFTYH